jgi:NitT/TauT family transport system ATP-binding protein
MLAVVGPSGCGKSTLLELICGLQQPDRGEAQCAPAALMPQRDLLLPWLSALDNAALAPRIAHRSRTQAREQARGLFAELGLAGFEQARPHELSGGMRQRVAFLRTLLSGKPVLCLDEPFGALDAITRAEMQAWLTEALRHEPRTVVFVTHDVEEAVLLADRLLILSPRPGRVIAELAVELPHPRSRTDAAVVALRERALATLSAAPAPQIGAPR